MSILLILILNFTCSTIATLFISKVLLNTYKLDQVIFLNYFMTACALLIFQRDYKEFQDVIDLALICLIGLASYFIHTRINKILEIKNKGDAE